MTDLSSLQSLGWVLPSPIYLVGALWFSLVGWVVYRRGRKQQAPKLTWLGVGLMVYPYGVSATWALWLVGLLLCAVAYKLWDA